MKQKRSCINWGKGFSILLAVMLVMFFVATASPTGVLPRAQPILLQMAAAQPDSSVNVIVQKTVTDASVEELIARMGGSVTKELRIINAFAAEVKAEDVVQLARAAGVRWVSFDAPLVDTNGPDGTVNTSSLLNAYDAAIGADRLWAEGYQGSSVTVAVVDSGMNSHNDIKARILTKVKTNSYPATTGDNYGHGTHVAGIIGGNGSNSTGDYIGIAPKVNLVSVKVTDDLGQSLTSDLVDGLQWVYDNRTRYNIKVVNLSINSAVTESYNTSPLDAAVEILWINRIVVVVSAGNNGTSGVVYPPANDPFVITVGAVDDRGTSTTSDDLLAAYSAYGKTTDGFSKPDLVAPGSNIISDLASSGDVLATAHPANKLSGASTYFRMSGTSMSSAVMAGAVALLLQDEPNLNPDQVKYRLTATARPFNKGKGVGAGYLDIYAAVHSTTTATANTGTALSQLLFTGSSPANWGSANWGSANWGSANWGSANWGSANWGSANWGSDYWGP